MIAFERGLRFAIFVDMENLSAQSEQHLAQIMNDAQIYGQVMIKRAYADWSRFGKRRKGMQAAGFELIELPGSRGKNSADMKLTVDALEVAFTKDFIDAFIIMSGDSDFIPLVAKLRELNRPSWLYINRASASKLLDQYCDRVFYASAPASEASESGGAAPAALVTAEDDLATLSGASPGNTAAPPVKANKKRKKKRKKKKAVEPAVAQPLVTKAVTKAVEKAALQAKADAAAVRPAEIKVTEACLKSLYWAMFACDSAAAACFQGNVPCEHPMHLVFAVVTAIDPSFKLEIVAGTAKRARVRLVKELQKMGVLDVRLGPPSHIYYVRAADGFDANSSYYPRPDTFESAVASATVDYRMRIERAAHLAQLPTK